LEVLAAAADNDLFGLFLLPFHVIQIGATEPTSGLFDVKLDVLNVRGVENAKE
jgi:hypothetical protein